MNSFFYYGILADALGYPSPRLKSAVAQLDELFTGKYPETEKALFNFREFVNSSPLSDLEEFYLHSFLLQPIASLDIGFVLFGEESRRNEFLVHIQGEQRKYNNDCGTELADHLPNILSLIPKISDSGFREELCFCILLPAINEISRKAAEANNPYAAIFDITANCLKQDFGRLKLEPFIIQTKATNHV